MSDTEISQPEWSPTDQSKQIRAFANGLLGDAGRDWVDRQGFKDERAIVMMLLVALFDAVRDEWQAAVAGANLEHELAIARKLMERDGYQGDPVCGFPGLAPMVAKIDGKDAVCFEQSMAGMMPLSAYYADKVRQAIDIAAEVGALVMERQEGEKQS